MEKTLSKRVLQSRYIYYLVASSQTTYIDLFTRI